MALALYLVVAAALCALLRRLVSTRAAMMLVALPLVFTAPAMFTGRTYAPLDLLHSAAPFGTIHPNATHNSILTDVSHQIIPWNVAVRESVRAGEWPLWNRLMLAGDALAASGQPAPYYPVTILSWLLPLGHALTFAAAMGFFVAGLGAYLFFRRIDLRDAAALFGAAAWMYATPVVFYLEWPLGTSLALLPLVLFGAESLVRDPVPGGIALTVALALLVFAGHPESVVHVVGAAVGYTVARFGASRRAWLAPAGGTPADRPAGTPALRFVVCGLVAGGMALAITAIYLLPIQDALPQTVQYTFRREVFARMDRSVPWGEAGALAIRSFVPFAYGRLVHDVADHVPQRYWLSDNGYAGSVVLALAAFALIRSRRRIRWLFLALALFGLLAGSDAPVVSELLAMLPLFKIALNERLIVLCAFGLVALAALGVEAIDARMLSFVAAGTLVVLAIAVAALWPVMKAGRLEDDLIWANTAALLVPLAILAAGRRLLRRRDAGVPLVCLIVLQRWVEMGDFWPTVDARLAAPRLELPGSAEPFRVVGLGNVLVPNSASYLGLEDVRGYQAMNLTFFHETYGLWSEAPPVGANVVKDLGRPFLDLMNVRYAFTGLEAPLPPDWRVIRREATYQIAENDGALPRAFLPRTVICGADALQAMVGETDFAARAWIRGDCAATETRNAGGRVRTTRKTPARLQLDIETDGPGWVVVTESAWRGWRAVDGSGKRLTLRRANHAFLAFEVPAGRTTVELLYRPRAFVVGAVISAFSLVLFAGFIIVWRRSNRRDVSAYTPSA